MLMFNFANKLTTKWGQSDLTLLLAILIMTLTPFYYIVIIAVGGWDFKGELEEKMTLTVFSSEFLML